MCVFYFVRIAFALGLHFGAQVVISAAECWFLLKQEGASKIAISPRRNAYRQPFCPTKLEVLVDALSKNIDFCSLALG